MAAITKSFDKITGRFACVYGGIRTEERSHDWCEVPAAVISKNPEEATEWLRVADRLEDDDNPAHIVIRAMFVDGYVPPKGFTGELRRGGRYMENGQHYYEGVYLTWDDQRSAWVNGEEVQLGAGFTFHYYAGGSVYRSVDIAEARSLLFNSGRRTNWCDVVAEGSLKPTVRVIPVGTKVSVSLNINGVVKPVNKQYQINETIPVPTAAAVIWYESQYTTAFPYKGYEVRVPITAIEVA